MIGNDKGIELQNSERQRLNSSGAAEKNEKPNPVVVGGLLRANQSTEQVIVDLHRVNQSTGDGRPAQDLPEHNAPREASAMPSHQLERK